MTVRSAAQRKADALDKLEHDSDVWVATASARGDPYLTPLSLSWDGQQVILATPARNRTARNVANNPAIRLALGTSRDVVLVDGSARVAPVANSEESVITSYADRVGWDPREEPDWDFILVRPTRVLVWREVDEIEGRLVMKDGVWLA